MTSDRLGAPSGSVARAGGVDDTVGDVTSATGVVQRFLDLLQVGDVDGATDLLAADVRYINVSLPTISGRDRVRRTLRTALALPGARFEVFVHVISVAGSSVLTERTDVLSCGPVRIQFWVCGRFDVVDGEIVMWRDYFDWWNFTTAAVRGLVGAVLPALRPTPPRCSSPSCRSSPSRGGPIGVRLIGGSLPGVHVGAGAARLVRAARAILPTSRPALATMTPSGDQMRDCAAATV